MIVKADIKAMAGAGAVADAAVSDGIKNGWRTRC
jgi:hypothetical protein